jgi:ribokinase
MTGKILIVGSANVDLVMKMDRLPRRGETITDADFWQTLGGKGANQAYGAALAGGAVQFVGCVGEDSYGEQIIANLRRAGVDVSCLFQEHGVATGTAMIMVEQGGENYLSVAPGANYRLSPTHLDQARRAFEGAAILLLQYEIRQETIRHAVDLAAALDIPVLFNLAPAHDIDPQIIRKVSILVVNETEAEFLCGFQVNSIETAAQAAQALRLMGPEQVIVTLGASGSYIDAAQVQAHLPAFPVQAVDTTAAGDEYCGCLAVALVEGKSIQESVRFASAGAAIAVTRLGAQPSLPTRQEIDRLLTSKV